MDRRLHFLSASTKDTHSVDKSHLPAPFVHTRHPLRRQAAAFSFRHPQKIPILWTKVTSGHLASTPGTPCVDRRLHFPFGIHKRYPFCGQKSPPGTFRPHQAPPAWTDDCIFLRHPQKIPILWTKVTSGHLIYKQATRHKRTPKAELPGFVRTVKNPN